MQIEEAKMMIREMGGTPPQLVMGEANGNSDDDEEMDMPLAEESSPESSNPLAYLVSLSPQASDKHTYMIIS